SEEQQRGADVDPVEPAGWKFALEAARAERVLRHDERLLPRHEPRESEPGGQDDDREHADIDAGCLLCRSLKVEAQAAVGRIARIEAERAKEQPRKRKHSRGPERIAGLRVELSGNSVNREDGEGDDPAVEDGLRAGKVVEAIPVQARAAVEIPALADLRPSGIDPEASEREEKVGDPDAEILGGRAGELRLDQALVGVEGGRWAGHREGLGVRIRCTFGSATI